MSFVNERYRSALQFGGAGLLAGGKKRIAVDGDDGPRVACSGRVVPYVWTIYA
jgi:hypothetical protein